MRGRIFSVFLLAVLASCSTPGTPGEFGFRAPDQAARVYARAYDHVIDNYLDTRSAAEVAWPGLQKLVALDTDLQLDRASDAVLLKQGGAVVERFPLPAEFDPQGWGVLTSAVVRSSKAASEKVAATPEEKLVQTVLDGVAGSLDKYSRYSPPEVAREQRAMRDGFGGIGVRLDEKDLSRIIRVTPGTPADRAGLKPEDRLAAIDGVPIEEIDPNLITRRLRGPVDSRVQLSVQRAGRGKAFDVSVTRAYIVAPMVEGKQEDGILFLKISGFNHSTQQNVADQIASARKALGRKFRGVVLDFRGNPGGLLEQSTSMADLFVTSGPILSTVGRNPASRQSYRAEPDDIVAGLPLVVLINGGSASAAEIVAVALQDAERAVVVGSTSYGKGTVQTVQRLQNEGEFTVTWAKILSPLGYSLNEHGVVPTICTSGLGASDGDIAKALRRGAEAQRKRKELDEGGWADLRKTCPASAEENAADEKIARRLLTDGALYAKALRHEPSLAASEPPKR
jgi:carboxyl-terminal processing protease